MDPPDELDFDEACKNGASARMLELAPAQDLRDVVVNGGQYGRIELIDHAAARSKKLPQDGLDDALYYAAQNGHPAVVTRLLQLGASPNATARFSGQSALVTAIAEGHVEIVRALLGMGAKLSQTKLALDESQGPLRLMSMLATGGGMVTVDAQLLHDAVYRGNLEIVQMLVEAGANVNHYDHNGGCPLDVAYQCDHTAIIEFLEGKGAHLAKARRSAAKSAKKTAKQKAKPSKKPAAKAKAAKKPTSKLAKKTLPKPTKKSALKPAKKKVPAKRAR